MHSSSVAIVGILIVAIIAATNAATCTYYGSPGEKGEQTATGESFNPMALTCSALPHVPLGSVVTVTNQRSGRSITVRVNDRYGAPPKEDALDLTYGAFGLLAEHDDGVFPCSYQLMSS